MATEVDVYGGDFFLEGRPASGGLLASPASVARFIGRGTLGAGIGSAVGASANPDRLRGAETGAAVGGLLANSPQALSRIALGVSDPALLAILKQTPRLISAASRDQTRR